MFSEKSIKFLKYKYRKTTVIIIKAVVSRNHLPYIIKTIIPEKAHIPPANERHAINIAKITFQLSVVAS